MWKSEKISECTYVASISTSAPASSDPSYSHIFLAAKKFLRSFKEN